MRGTTVIITVLSCSLWLGGCQDRYADLADALAKQQGIEITEIDLGNPQEFNALKVHLSHSQSPAKTKSREMNGISFDTTRIKTYHIVNSDLNFYFVPQANFSEEQQVNFSSAYMMDGKEVKFGIILKEELLTDKLKRIT